MSVKVKKLKDGKFKVTFGKGASNVEKLNDDERILFAAARRWDPNNEEEDGGKKGK